MKKEYVCKDSELATEGATDLWEGSLIDQLITEVIQSSHSRAAALAVDSAAAKLMQNAENISEYLLLRHQGLQQSIQSLQSHITSLLADIREIADCQEQMTTDVRMAMEEIDTKTWELLTGVCTSLEEELNDYFRSGKRKEQQMLEEEDAEQRRSQSGLWGKISQWSGTEIDGMNCQTKNQFNYKDNSYVFVLERGGAWCYDYTVSVVNLKTGKAQMIEYGDNQLCSGSNKPFFEIKNGVPTVGVIDTSGKPVVVAQDKLKI